MYGIVEGYLNTDLLLAWAVKITLALVVLVFGRWLVKIVLRLIKRAMQHAEVDQMLVVFTASILNVVLLLIVLIAALSQLGVDTTSLVALLGAAGLAVGLALQGSLSNLAAGVMLIVFKPFKLGDLVDAGGVSGVVEQINIFNTIMKTPDNKQVIVPNGQIYAGVIVNYSSKELRRIDMVFSIGYNDDIAEAKDIIRHIVIKDERVLRNPEPLISVAELADSGININVRPWVKSEDYWLVHADLLERVKLAFDKHGISIPYPQTEVHLRKMV